MIESFGTCMQNDNITYIDFDKYTPTHTHTHTHTHTDKHTDKHTHKHKHTRAHREFFSEIKGKR